MNELTIYAAGSLRHALPQVISEFNQFNPITITSQYSPAGLLRDHIIQQADQPIAHLFASANTAHPQTLVERGFAAYHTIFTHNRLCLVMRKQTAKVDWLSALLNVNNRIGMSTPGKDPSGDYTFALFSQLELRYPSQAQHLKQAAIQLVGQQLTSSLASGIHPAQYYLLNDTVDIFIGYASYANQLQQHKQLTIITIPTDYYPPIDYSIALLNHPHPDAQSFIDFLLSEAGQRCLINNGFIAR